MNCIRPIEVQYATFIQGTYSELTWDNPCECASCKHELEKAKEDKKEFERKVLEKVIREIHLHHHLIPSGFSKVT